VTAEQRAALLSALQDWDAWLTARETEAAPGYIVYRPAGDFRAMAVTNTWPCLLHAVHCSNCLRECMSRWTTSRAPLPVQRFPCVTRRRLAVSGIRSG